MHLYIAAWFAALAMYLGVTVAFAEDPWESYTCDATGNGC